MINFVNNDLDKKTTKLLKKIAKKTFKVEGQKARIIELGVEFVNDKAMKELNTKTRGVEATTDVLSFPNLKDVFNVKITKKRYPLDINPANNKIVLGDIVINLNKAKKQAKEFGHSELREVCYLFLHGLLHLLGYDHTDEMDKNLMRGQEENILKKFNLTRI